MKMFLISLAAAALAAVPLARAEQQGSKTDKTPPQTSSSSQSSTSPSAGTSMTQTPSSETSTSQSASSQTGTTASTTNELSGVVKKVDKDKRALRVSSPIGGEQELKVAASATITRDGNQAALDQIKEGDQVRASFDASGNQASKIEVTSKDKAKSHDMSKSDSKSEGKKY